MAGATTAKRTGPDVLHSETFRNAPIHPSSCAPPSGALAAHPRLNRRRANLPTASSLQPTGAMEPTKARCRQQDQEWSAGRHGKSIRIAQILPSQAPTRQRSPYLLIRSSRSTKRRSCGAPCDVLSRNVSATVLKDFRCLAESFDSFVSIPDKYWAVESASFRKPPLNALSARQLS
jgi:hypothetical protein